MFSLIFLINNILVESELIENQELLEHKNGVLITKYHNVLSINGQQKTLANEPVNLFTCSNNYRIVWENELVVYDAQWHAVTHNCEALYPWHGSCGIGQNDKCVMFAEYSILPGKIAVYRSYNYTDWEEVFSLNAPVDARHFHFCQPDPYRTDWWWVTTGDTDWQCHVFLSKDNGDSWERIVDSNRICRLTDVYFDENGLWWGQDNPDSMLVFMTRNGEIDVISPLSDECVRSVIKTDYGLLFFTEGREGDDGAEILLYHDDIVKKVGSFPISGGFTYSVSSIDDGNVFYTKLLGPGTLYNRCLKWKIGTFIREDLTSDFEVDWFLGSIFLGTGTSPDETYLDGAFYCTYGGYVSDPVLVEKNLIIGKYTLYLLCGIFVFLLWKRRGTSWIRWE
jgi:hypothetical protein